MQFFDKQGRRFICERISQDYLLAIRAVYAAGYFNEGAYLVADSCDGIPNSRQHVRLDEVHWGMSIEVGEDEARDTEPQMRLQLDA